MQTAQTADVIRKPYFQLSNNMLDKLICTGFLALIQRRCVSSGVARKSDRSFFPGGAKLRCLGTEVPQWGPEAKPPEADEFMIIMYTVSVTR